MSALLRWLGSAALGMGSVALLSSPGVAARPFEPIATDVAPHLTAQFIDININLPGSQQPVRTQRQRRVLVEFNALGDDWGAVYLNGRLVFRPQNFNRRQQFSLAPGAYELEITGITRFDVWASGFLDVGLNESNVLVIYFSKEGGVQVAGGGNSSWIPGPTRRR